MKQEATSMKEVSMPHGYKYTECGLDNVIVEGIEIVIDDAGEEVYCIPNVRGLHKVIAYMIITQQRRVSPKELRFLRTEMRLTQMQLAEILKVNRVTVTRWETGGEHMDQHAEFVVRVVAAEKLGIDTDMSMEDIARRCGWKSKAEPMLIDGRNPKQYRPLAA